MSPDPIGWRNPLAWLRKSPALDADSSPPESAARPPAESQASKSTVPGRPRDPKAISPLSVLTDYGTNTYHRCFPGTVANQAKVVEAGTFPIDIRHPEAKKFSNLASGASYMDEAYKRPTHMTPDGQAYIEKVRPTDGKPPYDVVAVAGSNDFGDWRMNLNAWPRQTEAFGSVHSGFNDSYNGLKPILQHELDPNVPAFVFGHSLGGSVATQLGVDLKRQGYDIRTASTIGMPATGGQAFTERVAEIPGAHVANERDPVPFAAPYNQIPGTHVFDRNGADVAHRGYYAFARPDVGLMAHSIPRYQESIHNHLVKNPEPTPPGSPVEPPPAV